MLGLEGHMPVCKVGPSSARRLCGLPLRRMMSSQESSGRRDSHQSASLGAFPPLPPMPGGFARPLRRDGALDGGGRLPQQRRAGERMTGRAGVRTPRNSVGRPHVPVVQCQQYPATPTSGGVQRRRTARTPRQEERRELTLLQANNAHKRS